MGNVYFLGIDTSTTSSKALLIDASGAVIAASVWPKVPALPGKQDWVVHCKPVGNGSTALKYLAPYIFRVALSNRRLIKLENDQVTFRYRSSDTGQLKFCTLAADEFIHRFLQHVLPKGFVKVRYFGFFAHSHHLRLAALRLLLDRPHPDQHPSPNLILPPSRPLQPFVCPVCGQPMRCLQSIPPTGRCPPI